MVTRLYLGSTEASAVNPSFSTSGWTEQDAADRRRMSRALTGSAMTNKTDAQTATGAGSSTLLRQYVSDILAPQVIAAGTWKGTVRTLESAANDNVDAVRSRLFAVSADGTRDLGDLSVIGNRGPVAEFNTALRAKRIADGDATSALTLTEEWRLVLEIGYTNTTAGASISATLNFGDNSATDLGDNETDTAANNPFIELSVDLAWTPEQALRNALLGLIIPTGGFLMVCDELSGALNDVVNGTTGTANGTPRYDKPPLATAQQGSISFETAGADYFSFADAAPYDLGNGPLTVGAAYRRFADAATWQGFFTKASAYTLEIGSDDKLDFAKAGVAILVRESGTSPIEATPHLAIVTFDGANTATLYKDNVDVSSARDATNTLADSANALEVGRESSTHGAGCDLGFVFGIKRLLTADERTYLYDLFRRIYFRGMVPVPPPNRAAVRQAVGY